MALGDVVNCTRLAVLFGVARTTVDTWVAEGCPMIKRSASRGDPFAFDSAEVHAWLIKRAVTRATADRSDAGDQPDLEAERALLAREQRIAPRR
jgi:phage terminase Nu1 subunit (DNA packaging protein)